VITGLVVGIPILFTDKDFVLDFTSIATLFAFVLVCGGVLLLPRKEKVPGRFSLPYVNGRFLFPLIVLAAFTLFVTLDKNYIANLTNFDFSSNEDYQSGKASFMDLATPNISLIIFWLLCLVLSVMAFIRRYSLIPLMGVMTCSYLLTGMTKSNWVWFISWLVLGLIFYFIYGFKKSKLAVVAGQ
jgi:hypothetical protein